MDKLGEEGRRAKRTTLNSDGALALEGTLLSRCKIVDVSRMGARLDIGRDSPPDRFQLVDVAAGLVYSARVVWRRPPTVGVTFLHSRGIEAPDTPEWIVSLWRELRQQGVGAAALGAARSAA